MTTPPICRPNARRGNGRETLPTVWGLESGRSITVSVRLLDGRLIVSALERRPNNIGSRINEQRRRCKADVSRRPTQVATRQVGLRRVFRALQACASFGSGRAARGGRSLPVLRMCRSSAGSVAAVRERGLRRRQGGYRTYRSQR